MAIALHRYSRAAVITVVVLCTFILSVALLRSRNSHEVIPKILIPEALSWFDGPGREYNDEEDADLDKWAQKNSDFQVLTSIRNQRGYFNKIDINGVDYRIFNPTILELPRGRRFKYDVLVIARATQPSVTIDGKKYLKSRQVAAFANIEILSNNRPILKIDSEWTFLMVDGYGSPVHHCVEAGNMDKYIGPEDMKLFWSTTGEPIVIFTHQITDEYRCQAQFIIDVRAAVPPLARLLKNKAFNLPPIRFHEPLELRRPAVEGEEDHPRYRREKNWAPVQAPFDKNSTDLLFMVEPGKLYRLANDTTIEKVSTDKQEVSRVQAPYPPYINASDTWRSEAETCLNDVMLSDRHVHQSTPMLSLTLCKRGECEPSPENTVLLGMIHKRTDRPVWYDRRIVTYSPVAPYPMLSVGRLLSYLGEVQGPYAWTGSMTYFKHHQNYPPTSHGYLDDEIWLGFGIRDNDAGWLDVRASDLVQDHYLCEGASKGLKKGLTKLRTKTEL